MNIEHPDQTFINLEARPPTEKEPLILPDYPEELKFSPLFSDADTLGGQWDIQNDDLLTLTLEPREIKAAAANLQWLAFQENLPLEEIAPLADLYRDTYSKEWFGGTVENELQFYNAIALRLKHQEEEEDRYDEEIIDNAWRTEHPKLDFALKIVRGVTGTILDTFGARPSDDEPFTQSEGYQRSRSSLSRLAELNPDSFNPAQAIAHDNGEGKLVLNPEGIGGLIGGVVVGAGTNFLGGGPRAFAIRKAADTRVFQAKERLKSFVDIMYDDKRRAFYSQGKRIPDNEVFEYLKKNPGPVAKAPSPKNGSSLAAKHVPRSTPPSGPPELYYDGTTDTFYDRGYRIESKNIEAYVRLKNEEKKQLLSRQNSTTENRQADRSYDTLQEPHIGLLVSLEQGHDVIIPPRTRRIRNTMSNLTIITKREVALLRMKDGSRVLRMGNEAAVVLDDSVKKIIAHTHPSGSLDFSEFDILALMRRRQKSSVIIDPNADIAMRLRIKDQLK